MSGYVSIIKNDGLISGGSLEHGHQQIIYTRVMPRQMRDHLVFEQQHRQVFSAFILHENPSELTVIDLGGAVLIVPFYMKRPYDMALILKDTSKRYLHQLSAAEVYAVANG